MGDSTDVDEIVVAVAGVSEDLGVILEPLLLS